MVSLLQVAKNNQLRLIIYYFEFHALLMCFVFYF